MATARKGGGASSGSERNGSGLDVDSLRQVVEMLEASDITRLVWRKGDERLFIRRSRHAAGTPVHVVSAPPTAVTVLPASPKPAANEAAPGAPVQKPGTVVTSPFVGTFYRAPSPDQPSFVELGALVKKGQVLCIVEAMKLMNEIEAEVEGRISEALVENGQPVEFGQPLFRIEQV